MHKPGMVKNVVVLLLPVVVLLVVSFSLPVPAFSQGSQGAIQGGVFDSSGGALVGATVTVTDVARGITRTLTTDEGGKYAAPALTAGTYSVRAQFSGFSPLERTNVLVEVGANVRVDLTLAPGEQTQTITVTEEIPAIDTTSATLGGTVSNQAIESLPMSGRNFLRLLELRPGVITRVGAGSGSSSSNGRRLGADVLLVEGITQFDLATSGSLINGSGKGGFSDASNILPIDAIQEFNTQQNAPAEYGWRDGSVVNVGIKSGTNGLHGSAYAFGRHAAKTDAKNYFTGVVTPSEVQQFGGTAGGPIVKDKVFWFVSYEGLRVKNADTSSTDVASSIGLTPADPTRSVFDACTALGRANVNALSAQLAGLTDPLTCVVSPASATVQNEFLYNPTTTISQALGRADRQPLNNGLAKGDWNINDKNHVSVFYYDSRSTSFTQGTLQPENWGTGSETKTQEIAGGWTYIPNSAWVNEVRTGFAGTTGTVNNADVGRLPSDPWPTGYSVNTGVTNRKFGSFPTIVFATSGSAAIQQLGIGGRSGRRGPQGQFNLKDTVSYLRGNHAFKFGFEFVRVKFRNESTQNTMGTIAFPNLQGFLAGTPSAANSSIIIGDPEENFRSKWFAGFIQDTWRITSRITLTPGLRWEYQGSPHDVDNFLGTFDPNSPGGVVQVGPGLPHEALYSPEKADFSPRLGFAWDIRGTGKTVLRGGISHMSSFPSISTIALSTPFGATLYDVPTASITSATVPVVDRRSSVLADNYAVTLTNVPLNWSQAGPIFPVTSSPGIPNTKCTTDIQCSTGALDPFFKRPKTVQWNVDIQHAITNNLTIDVAYAANHGYDETYSQDLNAVPVGAGYSGVGAGILGACAGTALTASAATIRNNCAVTDPANTNPLVNPSNFDLRTNAIATARPYGAAFPYYNYINRSTSGFKSNYNALQVTVDQRNFHGLRFLASYSYAHALDMWTKSSANTQQVADPVNNFFAQYASSDQDVRHRFRFSPSYEIPGIKSPLQMLEGWSINSVLAIQGRFPWGAVDKTNTDWVGTGENANAYSPSPNDGAQMFWNYSGPGDAFNTGFYTTRVGEVSRVPCYGATSGCTPMNWGTVPATPELRSIQSVCMGAAQAPYQGNAQKMALALRALAANSCYIQNGGILTPPAYGTNGNSGRNSFRGPQFYNVDLTVAKLWRISEQFSAEFRTELYNLFNSPALAIPSNNGIAPSGANFGRINTTADGANNIFGSGGPRHIQFGLKLKF